MRISAKEGWEGKAEEYAAGHFPRWFVLLDGKYVHKAIEADEESGTVLAYRMDENGHHVRTEARDDVETDLLSGQVKILDIKKISEWTDGEFARIAPLFDALSPVVKSEWARDMIDAEMPNRGL